MAKRLVWHELIIVQFLICPYTIPRDAMFFAYNKHYKGHAYRRRQKVLDKERFEDEKLAMGTLDEEEKVDFVSRKLWISANLSQYQKEKQEEYLNQIQIK